jgi:hypothetical protein
VGLQNSETIGSVTIAYGTGSAATAGVATYADQVTASSATGGTFSTGNYNITYAAGDIIVGKADLTVTADNRTKTYGTAVTFAGTEFTSAGLKNSETIGSVTLTSAGSSATATVAGSPYAITPSAATGGTFDIDNYSVTYEDGSITVNIKTIAVSGIIANNKIHDGTTTAVLNTSGASLDGVVSGDAVTLDTTGANGEFDTPEIGVGKTVYISGLTLSGGKAANYSIPTSTNPPYQQATTTADISPVPPAPAQEEAKTWVPRVDNYIVDPWKAVQVAAVSTSAISMSSEQVMNTSMDRGADKYKYSRDKYQKGKYRTTVSVQSGSHAMVAPYGANGPDYFRARAVGTGQQFAKHGEIR